MINPSPQLMMCLLALAPSTSLIMGVTGQTLAQDCAAANTVWRQLGKTTSIPSSCCTFQGVTCSGTRIDQINWKSQSFTGTINAAIGQLTALTYLNMAENSITGSLPTEIGNLVNLRQLRLGWNKLSGSIPTSIGRLTNLIWIGLQMNSLSGAVPNEIASLTRLQTLWLHNNRFTSVPSDLCTRLTAIVLLQLNGNRFSSFPTSCRSTAIKGFPNSQVTSAHYNLVKFATIGSMSSTSGLWGAFMGTTAGLRKRQFVSVEGTLVSATDLYNMCPLNNVQNADVPAGCVAGIYHKFCTKPGDRKVLTNCQNAYATVFAKSVFSSLGNVCPAWKNGPRSAECNNAINSFRTSVPIGADSAGVMQYLQLTSAHAKELVNNIFASSTYAPCNSRFQACASY